MLISLNWIKDFVELPEDLDAKDFGEKVTLATAEVEDVVLDGEVWEKVKIAKILERKPHPDADKLGIVVFQVSENETREVVCGAHNVKAGNMAAYAPLGVTLPNGMYLEAKKIRGVLSEGMLCSEAELGLSDDSEGIWELPLDAPLGQSLSQFMGKNRDVLLDIDNKSLTHRPDLWGHYGMAREVAAIFQKPLKDDLEQKRITELRSLFQTSGSPIVPVVDPESSCLGYFGLSIDGVEVAPSPAWMQQRLNSVGLRPINNIVDISNYVMLELGHPLHIFDRNKIQGGTVAVKRVGQECEFQTLDDVERKLMAEDTVICDSNGPLVLAGIMGGLNSGVSDQTTQIFIEVANWKAAEVRKTSNRLGLRTDSSQRYEKSLDSLQMAKTLYRVLDLVLQFCPSAKVVGCPEYSGPDLSKIEQLTISTNLDSICRKLGTNVEKQRALDILKSLAFEVNEQGEQWQVSVPSFRATKDVDCEADLVEEIGRMIGFDNIEPVSPEWGIQPASLSAVQKLHRKLRDYMVYSGKSLEVFTYPLIGKSLLSKTRWPAADGALILKNALSDDHDRMRNSLIPSILESVALNQKTYSSFRLFEIGRSYRGDESGAPKESSELIFAFYHRHEGQFLNALNCLEGALRSVNISFDVSDSNPKFKSLVVPQEWRGVHPIEFQNIRIMGKMTGAVFSVHPLTLKDLKIKGNVSLAVVDLTAVEKNPPKQKYKFKSISKYPSANFDCTVLASKKQRLGEILGPLKKLKVKELRGVKVVDVFSLNEIHNAITLRAHFQDEQKTMDGEILKQAQERIIQTLEKAGFPLKS